MPTKITATFTFHGHDLTTDVVNPGDWFGKTWLIVIEGGFTPLFLIVEADSVSDAIDSLADSDEFGHHILVAEADLADYDPETCEYSGSGKVIDTDWLSIHGCEGCAVPFSCRYHGEGLQFLPAQTGRILSRSARHLLNGHQINHLNYGRSLDARSHRQAAIPCKRRVHSQ